MMCKRNSKYAGLQEGFLKIHPMEDKSPDGRKRAYSYGYSDGTRPDSWYLRICEQEKENQGRVCKSHAVSLMLLLRLTRDLL